MPNGILIGSTSQGQCFKHRLVQSLLLILRRQSATPAVSVIWRAPGALANGSELIFVK
jgi:hypothetical protein